MMEQFFAWLSERDALQRWLLFGVVALLMAVLPFIRHLRVLWSGFLGGSKPHIHDFSWRLVPEMKFTDDEHKHYYLVTPVPGSVISGMSILLNWRVTGAWRVDLLPVAVDVKGNSAWVTLDANRLTFVLRAHTWRGVLTRQIDLREIGLSYLKTLSLSADEHFGQPASDLTTARHLAERYSGFRFSQQNLLPAPEIKTNQLFAQNDTLEPGTSRMEPVESRLEYTPILPDHRYRLVQRLSQHRLLHMGMFDPKKYNRVMDDLGESPDKPPSVK